MPEAPASDHADATARLADRLMLDRSPGAPFFVAAGIAIALAHPLVSWPMLRHLAFDGVAVAWPAAGLELAILLLCGRRMLPALFAGALFTEIVLAGHGVLTAAVLAGSSVLAAWAGATFLTRRPGFDIRLARTRDHLDLLAVAALFPLLTAPAGVAALVIDGSIAHTAIPRSLVFWWMGDALGIALVTTAILLWNELPRLWRERSRGIETLLLFALTVYLAGLVFLGWDVPRVADEPYPFTLFLPLTIAALRLGPHGVIALVMLIAAIGTAATTHGLGPFADDGPRDALVNLWSFIATLTLVGIPVATLLGERGRAFAALQAGSNDLRKAQDLAQLGKWHMDLVTGEQSWSEWIYRIYGRDTALPPPVYPEIASLFTPASWAVLAEKLGATLTLGTPCECDVEVVRPDGTRRWVTVVANAEKDAQGNVVAAYGTMQDVTDRKATEERLRALAEELDGHRRDLEQRVAERTAELEAAVAELAHRAERIEELYNEAPCGYHSTDMNGVLIDVNRTELEQLGRSREQVIGHHSTEFLTPEGIATFERNLPLMLERGSLRELEFDVLHADGSLVPMLVDSTLVRDAAGNPLRIRSIMVDNRERKARERRIAEMQEELARRADAAEAANRAKTSFLANMSHEIRTPLNAVIGFAHLLRREVTGPSQLERIDKIIASGRHLLGIIDDVLDLSKIESEQIRLEESSFRPAAILAAVDSMFGERMRNKGLAWRIEAEPELAQADFAGDALRIQQILLNFTGNALKFTERGGVTVRLRQAGLDGGRARLRFEVEDTGIGIEQATLDRLFQPFEQADASTSRRYGGTGLGLAISRRLARLMGGDAGVESVPGAGSTFWFEAPFAPALPAAGTVTPPPAAGIRRGARVLVAEDNEINQDVAREMLEGLGLQVTIAGDGVEAVERARDGGFDLVLMDMQMPRMDGLEATRRIRLLDCCATLPVIAMTANAFDDDRRRCKDAGMDDFLTKPVDPDLLLATLARWIPA